MKLPALKEIIEERKEKAIETLSENFAKNRLPLEEYERLVEYIHKIESERELIVVEKIVAEYDNDREAEEFDDEDEDEPSRSRRGRRINSNGNASVLSSRSYSGPLASGSQFISLLGSSEITIRKADLTKRRTEIHVVSVLGSCDIMVESGIKITNKAVPLLGNAGISQRLSKQTREGNIELVVSGLALLGDISIRLLKE